MCSKSWRFGNLGKLLNVRWELTFTWLDYRIMFNRIIDKERIHMYVCVLVSVYMLICCSHIYYIYLDLFHANTQFVTSQDVNRWTGVVWIIVMFYHSHSDGTHSLQSIHWWANDAMLYFSKSLLMKKWINSFFWKQGLLLTKAAFIKSKI